jgi:hypothetical protein
VLVVAFTLLAIPLFYQVRADAKDSRETAKNTVLSRFFRDVAKNLRDNPPEDLQVEDAWQQWQEENPNCGSECDPTADPDGDGIPNRDEVNQGRNPYCNEEREGRQYCAGQPNEPPPVQNATQALNDVLWEGTLGPGQEDSFAVKPLVPNYDRWEVNWELSGFSGVSNTYRVRLLDANSVVFCCAQRTLDFLATSDRSGQTLERPGVPPSGASYRVDVETDALNGSWAILIRGVRAAADAA